MYNIFAQYYDALQSEVDYSAMAEYILKIAKNNGVEISLLLDVACGTGSLIKQLIKRDVECIGSDISTAMLSIAQQKLSGCALLLNQSMTELDLYGTVNCAVCMLDSFNHLASTKQFEQAIAKISLFLEPGGLLIFDVNSAYKHEIVLGNNVFVKEQGNIYCVWSNHYNISNSSVDITLEFFLHEDKVYYRETEQFKEILIDNDIILSALTKHNFDLLSCYDDYTFSRPSETSQRIIYVAKRR